MAELKRNHLKTGPDLYSGNATIHQKSCYMRVPVSWWISWGCLLNFFSLQAVNNVLLNVNASYTSTCTYFCMLRIHSHSCRYRDVLICMPWTLSVTRLLCPSERAGSHTTSQPLITVILMVITWQSSVTAAVSQVFPYWPLAVKGRETPDCYTVLKITWVTKTPPAMKVSK